MTTTPPGWYDDGHGAQRWWDGARWTEHTTAPHADTGATTETAVDARPADAGPGDGMSGPAPGEPSGGPAPAAPRRSSLWIVWVVLGVVVLGTVIAAAVLIPLLVRAASVTSGGSAGTAPADPDQRAAVATVELYDDAWQNADCEAFIAATTEDFRAQSGLTDCSAFETEAEGFIAAVDDYEVSVTGVEQSEEDIVVTTTETFTAMLGEDGAPLDEPTADSIEWTYVLVLEGGEWLIDELQ